MASGFPRRDLGSFGIGVHQRSDGGGLLKRSLTELERQQQIQHALFLRSVKQRTLLATAPATMQNKLQELERKLLDEDDEEEEESASGVTAASEWGETMQQLISNPSPTTSSSSSSSTASCSPGSRQLLLEAAASIADGNAEAAAASLAVLKRVANPRGDPEQRLTAVMLAALLTRIDSRRGAGAGAAANHPIAELCSAEHQAATQIMYELSPCFKLALLASNLAILDAAKDSPRLHVVDFDVGQGAQYAALLHALVERHRKSGAAVPAVQITAVCDPASPLNCYDRSTSLKLVGDRIVKLAASAGVTLRFRVVARRAAELDAAALGCEPGEALAFNFAFSLSRVADESVSVANPRDELLRLARRMAPRVVAVAEQEVNTNTAPFAARFAEACGHYGAALEALDAAAGRDSAERAAAEGCLARRAANAVAREGAERVERCEVFGKWRARLGMAGLRPLPLGPAVLNPVRGRTGPGFAVKEEAGGLCFAWMGRVLTVASAWH